MFFKTNKSRNTFSQTFGKKQKMKMKKMMKEQFLRFFLKPRGNSEKQFWGY